MVICTEKYLSFISLTSICLVNMNDIVLLSWEYITLEKFQLTELGNRRGIMVSYENSHNEMKSLARVLSPR